MFVKYAHGINWKGALQYNTKETGIYTMQREYDIIKHTMKQKYGV